MIAFDEDNDFRGQDQKSGFDLGFNVNPFYLYCMNASVIYPQYRKYLNGKAYFKIISATEWEEIQVFGNNYILHAFTVKIMPDRNYIYDMTFDYHKNWEAIEENEYELLKQKTT